MDPANRLYGAKTLGIEASKVFKNLPKGSFVATRDYGLNGLVAFYMEGHPEVYQLPDGRRMSQYDFWNHHIKADGEQALFINTSPIGNRTKALFKNVKLVQRVPIYVEGSYELRKEFFLYHCFGYKKPENQFDQF